MTEGGRGKRPAMEMLGKGGGTPEEGRAAMAWSTSACSCPAVHPPFSSALMAIKGFVTCADGV